jgi:hypothetical protein
VPNALAYDNKTLVTIRSDLLLKIILQNTKTLQLFTINVKQKLLTKVIKNAKLEGLRDFKFY